MATGQTPSGGRRDRFELADFASLATLRDRCLELLNPILKRPWVMGGEVARDVAFTVGIETRIQHKLGRKPEGWIVVRCNAPALFHEVSADSEILTLMTDANTTASVLVY